MERSAEKPKEKDEDNFGPGEKHKRSRLASRITLARVDKYEDLNAPSEKEGNDAFIQKTRELWKELAVHGHHLKKNNRSDLDGKTCIGLMEKAKIDTEDLIYTKKGIEEKDKLQGRIAMDVGEEDGIVLADSKGRKVGEKREEKEEMEAGRGEVKETDWDLGKTAFFDHHGDDSKRGTCAASFVYDTLVDLGLLTKSKDLDNLIEFVRQTDSAIVPEGWNEEAYKKSWHTFRGLEKIATFKAILNFLEKAGDINAVDKELSDEELKKYGLDIESFRTEIVDKKDGKVKVLYKKYIDRKKELIDNSLKELQKIKENGFMIDSERYGKIVIDIGKKVEDDFIAAQALGANTYLGWDQTKGTFMMSTNVESGITDIKNFDQEDLKLVRQTMIIKKGNKPLTAKLEDVIAILTDGKAKIEKGLKEYIDKEKETKPEIEKPAEEKKEKAAPEPWEKTEDEIKLDVTRKMWEKIKLAEEDLREAKEDYVVSRAFFKMNAYGITPFTPLSSDDTISFRRRLLRNEYEEMKANLENLKMIAGNPEKARLFVESEERYNKKLVENRGKVLQRVAETKNSLTFFRNGYGEVRKKRKKIWTRIKSFFSKNYRNGLKELETKAFNGYMQSLEYYRKATYDEVRSRGLDPEDLRRNLSNTRRRIDLIEYLFYYSGSTTFLEEVEKKERERIEGEATAKKEKEEKERAEKKDETAKNEEQEKAEKKKEKEKKDEEKQREQDDIKKAA